MPMTMYRIRFMRDADRDLFRSDERQSVLRHELDAALTRRNEDVDPSEPSGCAPAVHMATSELT